MLAAAAGDNDEAVTWFERALTEHERTGPFERARTPLAYGSAWLVYQVGSVWGGG